ncbi:MAG: 4-hydroxy-tetrahydrodipicolinate synthase [Atopostipes suicloacalis]|nr:4-hydroxy-tetrahydrodipicolinate synthase [Atopostipes suicloacalis]MDN6730590.1 4-hydroxy-tetrahydrodipicolinate synthase [Atopostipes suicloacalis]
MEKLFTGVSAAVTTPFKDNQVDFESFEKHLQFLKDNNLQAFIINGTTAEAVTMSEEEKQKALEIALKIADGDIPVIAGTGSNSTAASIAASVAAEELGVDALLTITPYYNKTTQAGAIAHFTAIADAVNLPIVLYDVPSRTGMTLSAETVAELSKHPNIVALKDATGDLAHLSKMIQLVDEDFAFYSGNDDLALPFYATGGHGLISVTANAIPKEEQKLFELAQKDPKKAIEMNNLIFPFVEAMGSDLNPLPIKAITNYLGFGDYSFRLPLVALEEDNVDHLIAIYKELKEEVDHL